MLDVLQGSKYASDFVYPNKLISDFYENFKCFLKDYWLETEYWVDPSSPYFALDNVILLTSNKRFASFSPSLT